MKNKHGQVLPIEVTWTEAVKRCGTLKADVIGNYTGLSDSFKYRPFWTGFYRQSYEYWSPPGGDLGSNPKRKHCIAVKVNEDGTLYPITYPQICSKTLPTLCEKSTKVDGGWTDWSDWSECVQVNGEYKKSATRTCTNPSPRHGGKDCEGEKIIQESCIPPAVHGGWTDWSNWGECYFKNGMDKKSKTRTCTNPSPRHGGRECEGEDLKERHCLDPQGVRG
ncbi:netrin receptor UNC5A-like [Saccostrea echinata]|uniref:netrin receptor UNC5A-like n=1 Tax=Saccostrea echinata TaxID=191078 RepID=UPI002A7ECA07|nr:netrin receptor UNC5A-like [Saccostrea echinata]